MEERKVAIMLLAVLLSLMFILSPIAALLSASKTIGSYGFIANPNPPITGGLHVEGNKIMTENDTVVVFRGVDYSYFCDGPYGSWMLSNGQIAWNTWDTNAISDNLDALRAWGANIIRVTASTEWWVENTNNFRSNIQYFIQQAELRGIYIDLVFWRNNGTGTAPWNPNGLPFPPYDVGNNVINSTTDFVNMWADVANTLKVYPNVVFELWNEPNGFGTWTTQNDDFDPVAEALWFNVTQRCINAIRLTGSLNLIVVQWEAAVYVDFRQYPAAQPSSMRWVNDYPVSDSANRLIYSTHIYRSGFYNSANYGQVYSYSDMIWALNVTRVLSTALQKPVWIGEIGCSLWASDINNEYAWYNNTLTILDQYGIGYAGWAWAPWRTGATQWGLVVGGQPNFTPGQAGQILQQHFLSP